MNKFFTTLLTLAALAIAMPAGADHCVGYTTSAPEVADSTSGATYYVDNDLCQPDCIFSIWVYEESNAIDGLQRGDEVIDDTCHGLIEADTIIL